jgi:FkbM family methyltransferase
MLVGDVETSMAADIVALELSDRTRAYSDGTYEFDDIGFRPWDIAIDIGAHIGIVAIYLAKRWPFLTIYAYEAVPPVYDLLVDNLRRNKVLRNVRAMNVAVSSDHEPLELVAHLSSNTGGGTAVYSRLDLPDHHRFRVAATTLDDIFEDNGIERVKLLKMDIEGAEHQVLRATSGLRRVEHLRAEFHENEWLRGQGHTIEGLQSFCEAEIPRENIKVTACHIPDY